MHVEESSALGIGDRNEDTIVFFAGIGAGRLDGGVCMRLFCASSLAGHGWGSELGDPELDPWVYNSGVVHVLE